MINDDFSELIKLLNLTNIQIIESNEKVLQSMSFNGGEEVQINMEQGFPKDNNPQINETQLSFYPKYIFTFSIGGKIYFKTEYILIVQFKTENIQRFSELYANEEVREIFLKKQLHRTLWTILRGTVLDAFNRHSLKPIPLPWIIS